ncbi:hypothetical protein D3C71_1599460 [compost metagenome]
MAQGHRRQRLGRPLDRPARTDRTPAARRRCPRPARRTATVQRPLSPDRMGRPVAGLLQPATCPAQRRFQTLARGVPPLAPGPPDGVLRPWPDAVFGGLNRAGDRCSLRPVDWPGLERWRQRSDPRRRVVQLLRRHGRPGAADLQVLLLDADVGHLLQPVPVPGAAQPA